MPSCRLKASRWFLRVLGAWALFLCSGATAQSVADLYLMLPDQYVGMLTQSERTRLLSEGVFYPGSSSPDEVVVYRLTQPSSLIGPHLRVEMTFETGQRGFGSWELRSWTHDDGSKVLGVSHVAGTPAAFMQGGLHFFRILDGTLTNAGGLGIEVEATDFLRAGAPTDVTDTISSEAAVVAELCKHDDVVLWRLGNLTLLPESVLLWLERDTIPFYWTGSLFARVDEVDTGDC
jgi:hypothetical protein